MSPSIKTIIPVALLASTASCFSFLYPAPGTTNLTVAEGGSVIISWDTDFSGTTSNMALNCAQTENFTRDSNGPSTIRMFPFILDTKSQALTTTHQMPASKPGPTSQPP
jgi:hypothetical protein